MKPIPETDRRDLMCPHTGMKKPCRKFWDTCAFKWETIREYPDGSQGRILCCSQFAVAEETIAMSSHLYAIRAETGEVKNNNLYMALMLGGNEQARQELIRSAERNIGIEHKARKKIEE